MALRNKETGETYCNGIPPKPFCVVIGNGMECYSSLAEVNEKWEDYEEPETYYYISDLGNIESLTNDHGQNLPEEIWHKAIKRRKEIGNRFETQEETEKAVEKLKAWTRLENKGAEFYGWRRNQTGTYELYLRWKDVPPKYFEVENDLDLLFGGENELN